MQRQQQSAGQRPRQQQQRPNEPTRQRPARQKEQLPAGLSMAQRQSEDDALAAAIAASLEGCSKPGAESGPSLHQPAGHLQQPANQVEEDEALAQAIAASLRQQDSKTVRANSLWYACMAYCSLSNSAANHRAERPFE